MECDDGILYWVKGCQIGRSAVNEQIVTVLGQALGAPVAEVSIVDVPRRLIEENHEMRHMRAGLAHASQLIENCTDREWYTRIGEAANDVRHAKLAVLNGWLCCNDPQVMYERAGARLVFSMDHGDFFPGGPNWTPETLLTAAAPALDVDLLATCRVPAAVVRGTGVALASVTDFEIGFALARIPPDCDLEMEEREALAEFVASRRDALVPIIRAYR